MKIDGQLAIVTGGGSGLGSAMGWAHEGARVAGLRMEVHEDGGLPRAALSDTRVDSRSTGQRLGFTSGDQLVLFLVARDSPSMTEKIIKAKD
jgi:NAD(P)-dependent dehydrogenase (short-subunit alcohol dehydrogenase family)